MSRYDARTLAVSVVLLATSGIALPSFAETPRWWKSTTVQQALRLTAVQVSTIDLIFQEDLSVRRRLAREQDTLEAQLATALLEGDADDAVMFALVERVVHAEARRNAARTRMLVRMYRVLTAAQRIQFKQAVREAGQ